MTLWAALALLLTGISSSPSPTAQGSTKWTFPREGSSQECNCSGQTSQLALAQEESFQHNLFPLPNAHLGFKKYWQSFTVKRRFPLHCWHLAELALRGEGTWAVSRAEPQNTGRTKAKPPRTCHKAEPACETQQTTPRAASTSRDKKNNLKKAKLKTFSS